mgnify:CR=1 FL=1
MGNMWKKDIVLFLASQTISYFGSLLVSYAITWYITLQTKSGTLMTISILCSFLPTFFISPFGGVWADRYSRKMLIVISDSSIAISTLILALLFLAGYDHLWLLFFASAIRALGAGVQMPAINALIPQIVPEDKLTKVNASNSTLQSVVTLISPIMSAALLSKASIEAIFFIDVVTAAIAVLILLIFLKIKEQVIDSTKNKSGYFNELIEGFCYVREHDFVKTLFLFNAVFFILIAPIAFLTPLQVARSFGSDVWLLTALEVVYSAGMIIGGIIMTRWNGFYNRVHTIVFSNIIFSISNIAIGIVGNYIIYLFFIGLTGLVFPVFNIPFTVLLQEKVHPNFIGRVFGFFNMIASSIMPLGMIIFGPLSDLIKIEWLLIITGILLLAQSILMFFNRVLIEAGKPRATSDS